jgi:hypothetical protein
VIGHQVARVDVAAVENAATRLGVAYPRGRLETTVVVVAQGDGRENERNRSRRRDRSRHGILREIGAEVVELLLNEGEWAAGREVGGVDRHEGARRRREIAEGRAVEDPGVVVLGCQIASRPVGREEPEPVRRKEQTQNQPELHVVVQEALRKILEHAAAVETQIGGGEAAAGYARDRVDLVDEAANSAVEGGVGDGELFEHAVGECRGPGASPREGEHQDQLVGRQWQHVTRRPIALRGRPRLERLVHRKVGSASAEDASEHGGEQGYRPSSALSRSSHGQAPEAR